MNNETKKGSLTTYIVGYLLSLELTLIAYLMVSREYFTDNNLLIMLATLAIAQLLVQLVFFLHLSRESKPQWNLTVFLFAATVVIILVFGSLWIMKNLDYHMNGHETEQEIIKDEGIKPSGH